MKLFIYENYSDVSEYFQEAGFNVPFLGSTLFDYVTSRFRSFSDLISQELIIYVPESWEFFDGEYRTYNNFFNEISSDHEIVFITDLFTILFADLVFEDYHFLIQNPNKLFTHKTGLRFGYINNSPDSLLFPKEQPDGFSGITKLTSSNFLELNKTLINNYKGTNYRPDYYGLPVVITDDKNIVNSKVCAPSFIGENVKVFNSIIYPGTILTGNTTIINSEVFESFVCESTVKNSQLKNTLAAVSSIDDLNLEDSIIPRGSVLTNGRKK